MIHEFENKPQLGNGIYTVSEISSILRVPYFKVHTWLNKYWDGILGVKYEQNYSWQINKSKAVGFHTLVEFFMMMQFADAGVKPSVVLKAHQELAIKYATAFPFALKKVIIGIETDGKKIFLSDEGDIITLDGTKQLNLSLIEMFFKKLEFDTELLASRFWPLGKENGIVCDPQHKFGQPTISGTNILAETLYRMHLAEESNGLIAKIYDIDEYKVLQAIKYCDSIAA
jgi:uncharacterized protein (DUF433 family)